MKGPTTDNPNERRSHNRRLAESCAKAGLYVFPSSGKVPLVLAWERVDTAIGTDGIEEIKADARQRGTSKGRQFDEDTFVGCTNSLDTIKRMWRRHPDAVPSISLGPSNLYVIDADIDTERHGPTLLRNWLHDNDIDISSCPITKSRSGGEHVYFQAENFKSHVGDVMKSLYCQIKSKGNQVVAPGAWREDGKRYIPLDGQPGLLSSYAEQSLPSVPAPLVKLQTERTNAASNDSTVQEILEQIQGAELPDTTTLDLLYDFDALAAKDEEFKHLRDDPSADTSQNRFTYLKCLQREYGDKLKPIDYFALLQDADGMGEYVGTNAQAQGEWNDRNFARDFANSKSQWSISSGEAFGKVDVLDDDETYVPQHYLDAKAEKQERKKQAEWRIEYIDDLKTQSAPIVWLVEGLIEVGSSGIAFGAPGAGKTAWSIDLGMRIAHGLPYHGRAIEKRAVLYVAQEGMNGSKRRVQAWLKRAEQNEIELEPDAPFVMVRRQIDLFTSDVDYKAIRKVVREIEARTGYKVGLIVIDTVRAALVGGDENKQADTSIIMRKFNQLCITTGATVMGVHHTGKDAAKGASGSTNIIGSVDWSIEIQKGIVQTRKVRDAEDDQRFGVKTVGVEVGLDSAGKPTTAVVSEEAELPKSKRQKGGSSETDRGAAFGDVSGQDSENDEETPPGAVSDRSRVIAASTAEAIARSILAGDAKEDAMGYFAAVELAERCEALAEMAGPNMARKLKSKVFGNEVRISTPVGWLEYDPAKGRRGARFKLAK